MFERNKIDNIDHAGVPVELTTVDGEVQAGRLLIAMGRNIYEVLNSPGMFIEFEPYGGERGYLAKATLRHVKLLNVPKAHDLNTRLNDMAGFDPNQVLGLPAGAGFEEARAAWHRLSKAYHPDRYANAELPVEVKDYLQAMSRRLNVAYSVIEGSQKRAKVANAGRATPIYQSGGRA